MDDYENFSAADKAEATELQRMIAIEQQKAQFQAQVREPRERERGRRQESREPRERERGRRQESREL